MAIKATINYRGVTVSGAYFHVIDVMVTKSRVEFCAIFSSESGGDVVGQISFGFDYEIDGVNPICQAYRYLKDTGQLYDIEDILEDGQTG